MKNLGQMMKQAQEMQAKMMELQEALADKEVEGVAAAGMVRVTMNCKGQIRRIKIDPKLLDPEEVEVLEDLILAAANAAKAEAETTTTEEMRKLTGGLELPPGMQLPF
jgi:DNA-binding YbaB/EbfC family protein